MERIRDIVEGGEWRGSMAYIKIPAGGHRRRSSGLTLACDA